MGKRIQIQVESKTSISYFYYPDLSCKTKDGGMRMLIKELENIKETYKLKIMEFEDSSKSSDTEKKK